MMVGQYFGNYAPPKVAPDPWNGEAPVGGGSSETSYAQPQGDRTFVPTIWGGQGESIGPDGQPILGTSGAEQDLARYQQMGAAVPTSGPQIDQSRSNDSRGFSMGALGLLGTTASGAEPSQAELLGQQQTRNAQNAQISMGASVRGGAMARAAAGRAATMGAATTGQIGAQQQAATRAGEMATARDAYFGAATGQRGQDLGLATSQAQLNAQQRAQNEQHDQFYQGLGYNTKKAVADAQLGRGAADEAASNAGRTQAINEQAASRQNTNQLVGTGLGAATGGLGAYDKWQQGQQSSNGIPPPDQTGSDERMKQGVMPLYEPDGQQLHMSDEGRGYLAYGAPDVTSGASLSGPTPRYGKAPAAQKAQAPAAPMAEANRSMDPYSYSYKPGFVPSSQVPGETNVGPMANAMASDPVASTAVVQDPNSGLLAIDKEKGLKLTMGGLASLQRQVDEMKRTG